jgi:hypothetical protein
MGAKRENPRYAAWALWLLNRRTEMRNILKEFEKRVAALEVRFCAPRSPGLVFTQPLDPAERAGLGPGQRIVEDHYLDAAGKKAMTRERITENPSDLGKRFLDGSWDSLYLDRWKIGPKESIRVVWVKSDRTD